MESLTIIDVLTYVEIVCLLVFIISHIEVLHLISRRSSFGGLICAVFPPLTLFSLKIIRNHSKITFWCWTISLVLTVLFLAIYLIAENK